MSKLTIFGDSGCMARMSRKRHDSVEPYLRRDLRRKETSSCCLFLQKSSGTSAKGFHKGKGRAAYWPKRPKGQFLTRLGRWFRFGWLRKGASLLTLLLAVALSGRRGPVMQFARIIGAAADLSESTADVAVSASGASQLMPANGLTTGANLWKGVSLHDLHAHRCNGQLLVDGPDSFFGKLAQFQPSSNIGAVSGCTSTSAATGSQ